MIGIIVNPHARHGADPGLAERLAAQLRAQGAQDHCPIIVTRDAAALSAALSDFARRRVPIVATCGGDGTIMATVTGLLRAYKGQLPRLLILRGGSVNTIARNLRLSGRPEELLTRALPCLRDPGAVRSQVQDLIRVHPGPDRDHDTPEDRYGCLFAAAMGARFLEMYYQTDRPGLTTAAKLVARTVGSTMLPGGGRLARRLFADTDVTLTADGETLPLHRARLILAATVADVGMGMRVTWRGGRNPGRFHLVASRLPIGSMARQLHRVLRGRPLSGPDHVDRPAQVLHIRFPERQAYTLDGDLFHASEITVRIGPQLHILHP